MRAQEYPYFTISKTILIAVTLIFDYAEEIRHCFNDIVVLHLRVDSLYAARTFTQFYIARRERETVKWHHVLRVSSSLNTK